MMATEEIDKSVELLQSIQEKTKDVTKHVDGLLQRAQSGEYNTSKGISFLEFKYQLMLSYLINLTYTMLRKSQGNTIDGDPAITRLVELRTVLEKMKPIDQKLKYQIDKVMKIAATGVTDSSDPLQFKANPDNFVNKLEDDESETDEEQEGEKKSKVYRPPKLAAVHYDGDQTLQEKQQKAIEKAKKRALSSSMIKELHDEYHEGPEEIKDTRDVYKVRAEKKSKERTEYEEEHFVRLSISKKEKNDLRRMNTTSSLNSLVHFDDISALTGEPGFEDHAGSSKKKRKLSGKGKKGKKGFKKRRKH